jgi:hypothetical protein
MGVSLPFFCSFVEVCFFCLCLCAGVFFIGGSLYKSHLTNTTFRNITAKYTNTQGGVLYVNTLDYGNITCERCIFVSCTAYYGGVFCLNSSSPYIIISRCRFENNTATFPGYDIYCNVSSCFSTSSTVPTGSCTTSADETSVFCYDASKSVSFSACSEDEIVSFFFNYYIAVI